jgi:hypothetical protein
MRNTLFRKNTDSFIETGTCIGDGVDLAIKSGFNKIFSIEISQKYYNDCLEKFKSDERVELILGDSFYELEKLLNKYPKTPFTYWLDGHYSGDDTGIGVKETPLLKELEVILKRDVEGELIYIDDMRIYRTFDEETNFESIIEIINIHKPNAKVWYEASQHDKEDVLCIEY